MVHNEYNPEVAHTFAARLGLVVAGCWLVSFLIVVLNFPSWLSELGYLMGLMPILIIGKNIRLFRTHVMPLTWWQGLTVALLAFMGGTLILTLGQYVYFAYFDHGLFLSAMQENLENPEMEKLMREAGNGPIYSQMTEMVKQMAEMSPRAFTLNLFTTNVTFAIIFSFICSLFRGVRSNKK